MTKNLVLKIAIAALGACAPLFAAEADQFSLLSTLPREHVQTFAATGEYVYALSSGNLTILNVATPGQRFGIAAAIPVDRNFVELAASEWAVALASRNGTVELYERRDDTLVFRSRTNLGDSVLAVQIFGNQLFAARGYSGTSVIDIADLSHPTTMDILTESDYSAAVAVTEEFLYVLDRLNGVTVYTRSGDTFVFSDEILTELPPLEISAAKFGVVICFGAGRLEYWFCSTLNPPALVVAEDFDFGITSVAANPNGTETLILGGANGEVVEYRPLHIEAISTQNLGFPIKQLTIAGQPSSYLVLDRIGNLSALRSEDELRIAKSYVAENAIGATCATTAGLIMSTARGVELAETQGSSVSSKILIPGFPLCQALAESEPYLFAAANGAVSVFRKERGEYGFVADINSGLTVRNLFTTTRSDDRKELIVVGQEGVIGFELADDDRFTSDWSFDVETPIICSDVANGLMALAADNGVIVVFNVTLPEAQFVERISAREHPRDLAIVENNYVAIAGSKGVQIYRFESGGESAELDSPIAIPEAHDLFYDPSAKALIVADGLTPVKYLDFSDPEHPGVVFLISNSDGAARVAYRENRLYCLSNDWMRSFERNAAAAMPQASTLLVHSVVASPNPFNSSTEITISLDPRTSLPQDVDIELVNILGQTLASQRRLFGTHSVSLSLSDLTGHEPRLASGIYFCRIGASGNFATQKLLLLK
ncbi:MAG: T9SS type A sorting domain-containing protein [Candidatus Zixiibacteriota bacterium]